MAFGYSCVAQPNLEHRVAATNRRKQQRETKYAKVNNRLTRFVAVSRFWEASDVFMLSSAERRRGSGFGTLPVGRTCALMVDSEIPSNQIYAEYNLLCFLSRVSASNRWDRRVTLDSTNTRIPSQNETIIKRETVRWNFERQPSRPEETNRRLFARTDRVQYRERGGRKGGWHAWYTRWCDRASNSSTCYGDPYQFATVIYKLKVKQLLTRRIIIKGSQWKRKLYAGQDKTNRPIVILRYINEDIKVNTCAQGDGCEWKGARHTVVPGWNASVINGNDGRSRGMRRIYKLWYTDNHNWSLIFDHWRRICVYQTEREKQSGMNRRFGITFSAASWYVSRYIVSIPFVSVDHFYISDIRNKTTIDSSRFCRAFPENDFVQPFVTKWQVSSFSLVLCDKIQSDTLHYLGSLILSETNFITAFTLNKKSKWY